MVKKILLIFRKPRYTGNFSIETSFNQMMNAFPKSSIFKLNTFTSSFLSNGILQRWKAIREVSGQQADLYHITGDVHYLVLGAIGKKSILTVHDCGFMKDTSGIKQWILKKFWLDLPVKYATVVTAVSEMTKQDIIKYTQCPADKIRVIPTIISNHYQAAKEQANNDKPVLLHIGLAHNKNFERHVEAIAGMDVRMHIIGKLEEHHVDLLKKHQIDYQAEYNISDEAMQAAYEGCDLLLFASTLEGFGMPIIEAQTVGRPVVTSNLSSMPEVGGEGVYYVDPYEVESIREGVKKVLGNKDLQEQLIANGKENLKRFDADVVAKQYEELYLKILNHH